ncbi:NTP transferase domain-containing protein [Luteimicrobium album]|uniref:NTP transferase domain-containing protein n=1 Tax=Luteimicrobium album TaxID=1054550 RepID=UPI0024E179D9|nr:NTP transferase domain-containing protein [Luteimicrobium album]
MPSAQAAPARQQLSRRAAVLLAAGHDAASHDVLTQPLGDSTVVQRALETLNQVVDRDRTVVVVAAGDTRVRELLGPDLTYVEQSGPAGTGPAALAARAALPAGADVVLTAYADTPLLRSESLLGLLTRHALKDADLTFLTAVLAEPRPAYDRVVRVDGRVTAIVSAGTEPAAGRPPTGTRSTWAPTSRRPRCCSGCSRSSSPRARTGSRTWPTARSPTVAGSRRTRSTTPTRSTASTRRPSCRTPPTSCSSGSSCRRRTPTRPSTSAPAAGAR